MLFITFVWTNFFGFLKKIEHSFYSELKIYSLGGNQASKEDSVLNTWSSYDFWRLIIAQNLGGILTLKVPTCISSCRFSWKMSQFTSSISIVIMGNCQEKQQKKWTNTGTPGLVFISVLVTWDPRSFILSQCLVQKVKRKTQPLFPSPSSSLISYIGCFLPHSYGGNPFSSNEQQPLASRSINVIHWEE